MKYSLDINGYVDTVLWGCNTGTCQEYTGNVPTGYATLVEWATNSIINAYYIDSNGNLTLDAEREAELRIRAEQQAADYSPVLHKEFYAQQEILESQYVKGSSTGTILELTDAKNMATTVKLTNVSSGVIDIFASGKNMLKKDNKYETISGLTFSEPGDPSGDLILVNGTATDNVEYTISGNSLSTVPVFSLHKNTDYYLSVSGLECEFRYYNGETVEQVYSGTGGTINLPEDKKVTHVVVKIPSGITCSNKNLIPELYYGAKTDYYRMSREVKVTTIDLSGHTITDTENASLTISGGLIILQADGKNSVIAAGNVNLLNGYNLFYTSQGNSIEIEYCKDILDINSLEFLQGKGTTSNRFMVLADGSIVAHNGYFSGELNSEAGLIGKWNIDETSLWGNVVPPNDDIFTSADANKIQQYIMRQTTLTDAEKARYDINGDGKVNASDWMLVLRLVETKMSKNSPGKIILDTTDWKYPLKILDGEGKRAASFGFNGVYPSPADYVVEEGTSGIWTYRKWNSGVAECWGVPSKTVSSSGTYIGAYAFSAYFSLPSGLFKSIIEANANPRIGSGYAIPAYINAATTQLAVDALANNGGSQTFSVHANVIGRWK